MPQTTISDSPAKAYKGQLAEPGAQFYSVSRRTSEAGIEHGDPVQMVSGSEDTSVEVIDAAPTIDSFLGFVMLETSRPDGGLDADSPVSVLRKGVIYLDFAEAVTAGEQVGLTVSGGALTGIPEGTAAAAIATGTHVLPGCRIMETTTAAGLARVEVDLFGRSDYLAGTM